ncbi:MAG: ribosomal protein S18-alanine N-acetyltransferase [Candidatus Nanopelagicales bacterium]|nr:ribosomal protein S18-alanine N-acetyltransferase [Candidatus Nanopelagicales bacterium]MDZ4248543.1 ribosomal protein S18-alanine N-acetyltransferase [Candidatus Nanopelagicales bacterium]MDZ7577326.1 ribosomal protein S18-alanine N-acetyltransferase [Candidatus Nanopelagicales bacterium]
MVRPLTGDDVPDVAAMEKDLFGGEAWTAEQIEDELARVPETRWYAGAESGGRLVGYVGLFLSPPDADVQTIAVDRSSQGQGLGRALLDAAVDHATEVGCMRVLLEVRADNDVARGLYQSSGFVETGRRRRYYVDGTDAVVMRLRIPACGAGDGGRDE